MKVLSASTGNTVTTNDTTEAVEQLVTNTGTLTIMDNTPRDSGALALGGMASKEAGDVNKISFTLPSLPGSVNLIYGPRRTLYSQNGWGLKDEWTIWATRMIPHILVLPRKLALNSIVRVDRCYFYPWFTKEGNWRRVDTANMDKLLFDTIAKKIGIDDRFFKQGWMDSWDDPNSKVTVILTEVPESQWRQRKV